MAVSTVFSHSRQPHTIHNLTFSLLIFSLTLLTGIGSTYATQPFTWIGAVNSTSFTIHADVPKQAIGLFVSDTEKLSNILQSYDPNLASSVVGDTRIYGRLRKFTFTNLNPSTLYYVGYTSSGETKRTSLASITTYPPEGKQTDLILAFSSCQFKTKWDTTYSDILRRYKTYNASSSKKTPFVFAHMGDLAYSDISDNTIVKYEQSIRNVITRNNIHPFFNSTSVVYMYDDHDFGANNADGSSPSKSAAVSNYLSMIPHHHHFQNVSASSSLQQTTYHSFTIGRIRFIITDLRSNSFRSHLDNATTVGKDQLIWLENELSNSSSYSLMIWLSTKPWIASVEAGADSWSGFHRERTFISSLLIKYQVFNLIMISGDAHMLAVDDGSNSFYADGNNNNNVTGFHVFQAAPLHHFGSTKGGGPYSHGCKGFRYFPTQQYAILHITDNSDENIDNPCIQFKGYRVKRSNPLIQYKKCGRMSLSANTRGSNEHSKCSIPWLPAWVWVVFSFSILWITAFFVAATLFFRTLCARGKS